MYITNDPVVAASAQAAGVERIFIDLEINGKEKRQGHLDTVISRHSMADVARVRTVLDTSELLVRVNPVFEDSREEINTVIESGADVVMLPYFKTRREVETFVGLVDGRAKVCLLCETKEAAAGIDDILEVDGIDQVHVGINDLCISFGHEFMFQEVANGTVEKLCASFKRARVSYGFGGLARLGAGALSAEYVLGEHYRLGSGNIILSRAFCDTSKVADYDEIDRILREGVREVRAYEEFLSRQDGAFFEDNHRTVQKKVDLIVERIRNSR